MSKAERYAELDSRDEFSEIHTVTPKRRSMILDALEKHAQKFPDIYLVPPPAPASEVIPSNSDIPTKEDL